MDPVKNILGKSVRRQNDNENSYCEQCGQHLTKVYKRAGAEYCYSCAQELTKFNKVIRK